ncbi:TPA: site-specific DNA-methyltransferase [Morganella morganii]|nr:site-specific DNA-methyltransferase [Morganella morganii]
MEKLKMHSPNLTQDNIARIRDLFPGCVTEAKGEDGSVKLAVDFDQLRQELAESIVEGPQERYHLNWPGKREAMLAANAPIAKTLRPVREESVDFDTTKNLFIEGDNLDALKLLQETYLGKVKMIYIDPPYNTGNDFIYEDDFSESTEDFLKKSNQKDDSGRQLLANTEANGRFHSDWLSMIYPRLKLARNLLQDDGVIFISIDDNEAPNLRKICDEVFGSENQINPIIHNKLNSKNDTINVQRNHEYILCYRKRTLLLTNTKIAPTLEKREIVTEEVFADGDRFYVIKDPITTRGDGGTLNQRKNLGYSVYYNPKSRDFIAVQDYDIELAETSNVESDVYSSDIALLQAGYTPIRPPKVRGRLGAWTWELSKFNRDIDQIVIQETRNGYSVRKRVFVNPDLVISENKKYFVKHEKIGNSRSIIEYSTNEGATQLSEILGKEGIFSNPKNVNMLEYLIRLIPSSDFIFLDFFAGSGSSIQALMNVNSEDMGARRFIAVQIPEVCEKNSDPFRAGFRTISEVTKERIRRAAKLVGDKNSKLDTGFRVLKIGTSNMAEVYYTPDALNEANLDLFVDNIKPDRTPEDLLFQVMLDWGVDLALPITKQTIQGKDVFFVDGNVLTACFDASGSIDETFVKELAKLQPLRVVFRDAGFKNSAVKINVEQIFTLMSPVTEVKCI